MKNNIKNVLKKKITSICLTYLLTASEKILQKYSSTASLEAGKFFSNDKAVLVSSKVSVLCDGFTAPEMNFLTSADISRGDKTSDCDDFFIFVE